MTAAVFWPAFLGVAFLAAGLVTYRRELRIVALGPVFVAAALAAFAGEHFTAAATLAKLVPSWLPARLFIAYFVGVAHLAAALSFVARRYVRWAALSLSVMFALFVLLMDLPAALSHPGVRIDWSLAVREGTFAMGALALFALQAPAGSPAASRIAGLARLWTAGVLVFYGLENILYPQFSPGVPDLVPTPAWVPQPAAIAYATGLVLVVSGALMLVRRYARAAAGSSGLLMVVLTVGLYVPQFFLARDAAQQVEAINFVFDTLLFAGMLFVISQAIAQVASADVAASGQSLSYASDA